MRTAIVHEWLTTVGGSEKVLEQLLVLYPNADLFAVCDFLPASERSLLRGRTPQTTFIQRIPFARRKYRALLPLMPLAIEQLDLSGYDLVISSSHAVAKGILTGPNQLHISYVHSPMRYAWDMQHQYLREAGLTNGPRAWLARWQLHKLRIWDQRTANGVDDFVANSRYIARRISKAYGRDATVIYPPVSVVDFPLRENKEDFYVAVSRMVPYKRMDLIAEAFAKMGGKQLVMVGDGPDREKIRATAGRNVTMAGYQDLSSLADLISRARALVFAAEEDFGIVPVEAMACGTPVIAFGRGGALETVVDGKTGMFFPEQTPESIARAVQRFEQQSFRFDPASIREHALSFSPDRFRSEIFAFIEARCHDFKKA